MNSGMSRDEGSSHADTFANVARFAGMAFELALTDHLKISPHRVIAEALDEIEGDLFALLRRDPACRFKPLGCQLSVHSTFFAVASYRLAHSIMRLFPGDESAIVAAMRLSFSARSHTGVEIHPEARIGKRLVVDHGFGTVIGQTVDLGDDAYILNGVVLGGRSIGDAPEGKRHPTIGHRVQIGGNARVLGPVVVGDDCVIGPDCVVTTDLPDGARVNVTRTQKVHLPMASAAAMAVLRPRAEMRS